MVVSGDTSLARLRVAASRGNELSIEKKPRHLASLVWFDYCTVLEQIASGDTGRLLVSGLLGEAEVPLSRNLIAYPALVLE